ncbi:RNA 2'-phosphotransferase [Mesorhizobium sp. CGMCC 1.15528]|uniref:Probable RNA 2'-phosphotransferase n=1 Tax=Mesorhizobium zhangyense TaxID=1776730 RepID=A0A7C9R4A8_9HYPH|nr:RNA 2'-phosphotransferase [Mesorhizobium zhangyense]NGN39654.1 RNA 2'-phosphotransferase [Mesorhizobium zhangyense]
MSRDVQISKFMSLVLRHSPEEAGLTLDENGWVDFDDLYRAIDVRFGVAKAEVERIVAENPKKRFTLINNRIRAAQGHSVGIDLQLTPSAPPAMLYHGTKTEFLASILKEGLQSQSRQHVHLSNDIETARIVARRRKGADAILAVDSSAMSNDGIVFFLSENDVWLTDHVAPRYLKHLTERDLP